MTKLIDAKRFSLLLVMPARHPHALSIGTIELLNLYDSRLKVRIG
jgi:hypothetical protein